MTAAPPKLAIFGDSHYACLRLADNEGLVDLSGMDLEYWGHVGRRFRFLEFREGAIHPTDEVTAARFAKFNDKGRTFLPAADFDHVLFMGCRIDLSRTFIGMLDAVMRGQFLSTGLRRAMLREKLENTPNYSWARNMAACGKARIYLHSVTLFAVGCPLYDPLVNDDLRRATRAARAEVWQFIADEMAQDGVTFLPQPDHTISGGIYTSLDYITHNSLGEIDFTHRNSAYGALVFEQLLAKIRA
ncbi:MAG: hypothetical protein U5N55_05840 [Cypionkella sp.]|nr:hypothetical protein [Cypionkella sp.]